MGFVPLSLVSFGSQCFCRTQRLTCSASAFGVAQAYTRPDGSLDPSFNQAIGLYLLMWALVVGFFVVGTYTLQMRPGPLSDASEPVTLTRTGCFPQTGALRTSVSVVSTLVFTFLNFLTLAIWKLDGAYAPALNFSVFSILGSSLLGLRFSALLLGYLFQLSLAIYAGGGP